MDNLIEPKFSLRIEQRPFERVDGRVFRQTAQVRFDSFRKQEDFTLGLVEQDDLFPWIASGEPLHLDDCVVIDFSLEAYRKYAGLEVNAPVTLVDFSAKGTVFVSRKVSCFAHAIFTGDRISFAEAHFVTARTEFLQCRFPDGDVDFSRVDFGSGDLLFQFTQFGKGELHFEHARFGFGKTSFVNTDFGSGKVVFRGSHFGPGEVEFHFARFGKGDKLFDKTVFESRLLDFRKVEFGSGKIDFRSASFGSARIIFDESEVERGKINFNRSDFGSGSFSWEDAIAPNSELSMEKSELRQTAVSFSGSTFRKLLLSSCQFSNHLDLRVKSCNLVDLSDTLNRDLIDLKPTKHAVDIKELYLTGMRNVGRIMLDWRANKVEQLIVNQPASTLWEKTDQFRILKEDFRNSGQYQDEDLAYVAFKRMELKAEFNDAKERGGIHLVLAQIKAWNEWLIFDQIGRYATDPIRVLTSMFVVYVLFSLSYVLLIPYTDSDIVSSLGDPDHLSLAVKSFYHSAITFLTIGYGDYYPSGSIRWLSSLEGFVGLFLMSYFTVAFVRKILR